MKKSLFLLCAALVLPVAFLGAHPALGAPRPMRVRQAAYDFEFDVYRTDDMPANWFKTYDGYYVARRLDTNWVYGRQTGSGWVMTDVLVGSVDPRRVGDPGNGVASVAPARGTAPRYTPPERDVGELGEWSSRRMRTRQKVNNPQYQKELEEIIKGLKVREISSGSFPEISFSGIFRDEPSPSELRDYIVSTFMQRAEHAEADDEKEVKKILNHFTARRAEIAQRLQDIPRSQEQRESFYDYEYRYLTRNHFPTKVPLDFHIIHQRDTGHVEFYVTVGLRGAFQNGDVLFLFDDRVRREDGKFKGNDFYLLRPLPFERTGIGKKGTVLYGLRLATTSRTWLPTPTYMSLMQKISRAKRVRIYSISGEETHYDRKKTWKLLGVIELAAIDQKNRFMKSMEARYETYKRIVEFEERWQGPFTDEPERPFSANVAARPGAARGSWRPGQILEADEIYNLLTTGNRTTETRINMLADLTGLFGDPKITRLQDPLSNLFVARMTWEAEGDVRIDADYYFQGGSWNENRWGGPDPISKGTVEKLIIDEHRKDGQRAFTTRVNEFTEMLGRPKLKQSSLATWLIGDFDEFKFVIRRKENSLSFSIEEKEMIRPTLVGGHEEEFWPDITEPVR